MNAVKKKMITDVIESMSLYHFENTIRNVIENLESMEMEGVRKGYKDIRCEIKEGYYSEQYLKVTGKRLETEKEYNIRLKKLARSKERKVEKKKGQLEKDLREYNRLKAKLNRHAEDVSKEKVNEQKSNFTDR